MDSNLKGLYELEKAKHKAQMEFVKAETELRRKEIELKKEAFKGNDGYTPIKGKDYFTKEEIESISKEILSLIPKPKDGVDAVVDYEKILKVVYSKINEIVSKIPTQKGVAGQKGERGEKGEKGEDGKTPVIDTNKLTKEILALIKKDKSLSVDYQNIFKELEKQVYRMRETMPVGSSNSLRGLIDADLTGVPQDAKGNFLLGQTWDLYVTNWSVAPSLNGTITGGSVYDYTLNGTTRYRFVPDPYDPTLDAFYSTFSAGVLSDIIVTRG